MRLVQAATLWRPSGLVNVSTNAQIHQGQIHRSQIHQSRTHQSQIHRSQTHQSTGSLYLSGTQFRSLQNQGTTPLYVTRRLTGFRLQDTPLTNDELNISQHYFHADGSPANLTNVKVGDLIVVANQLDNTGLPIENALFVDALPAGFVIENPRLGQGINLAAWRDHAIHGYDSASPDPNIDYERYEVKRYSAAFSLQRSKTLVYQMRAVASGNMADPGASLEDFYAPRRRTTTGSTGQLTIFAKQ